MIMRIHKDQNGAIIAELAAILPVLTLLLLGGVEVGRYALLNQKLDRVATSMADLVSQAPSLTTEELDSLFAASQHVANPFDLEGKGVVVITSVGAPDGTPIVNWQRSGAGNYVTSSRIGTPGNDAELPDGMEVGEDETVIVAEVFFDFHPFVFGTVVEPTEIYHNAFYRPRVGMLNELDE